MAIENNQETLESIRLNSTYYYYLFIEGPRSRSYGRTASLEGLLCNPTRKMIFFLLFHFNGAPVELN
jgi:hypothetical protein